MNCIQSVLDEVKSKVTKLELTAPCCRILTLLVILIMPGSKQRSTYRKKRARIFSGKRKQEVTLAESDGNVGSLGPVSTPSSSVAHSPPKRNKSEEKINENCPLIIKQNEAVVTRRRALELGIDSQNKKNCKKSWKPYHIKFLFRARNIISCDLCQLSKFKRKTSVIAR